MRRHSLQGFTILELLVVTAMVAILSTIVLVNTVNFRSSARDDARRTDLKEIQLALEIHFEATGQYPASLSDIVGTAYLPTEPIDPATEDPYVYTRPSPDEYQISAVLENSASSEAGFCVINTDTNEIGLVARNESCP